MTIINIRIPWHVGFTLLFKRLLIAWLLLIGIAHADTVTFAWDPVEPTPDGYRFYMRDKSSGYSYDNPDITTQATTCQVEVPCGKMYYFVVRAFVGSDSSVDSNEVKYGHACKQTPSLSED